MEYKVIILSDDFVNGQVCFDFNKFSAVCAYNFIDISDFLIEKLDLNKNYIEKDENLIIFCNNINLDNLIINNIKNLSGEKILINDQVVIFKKRENQIIFVPLEIDFNIFEKVFARDLSYEYLQFGLFGLGKERIVELLENLKNKFNDVSYKIFYHDLLCNVYIKYQKKEENLIDDVKLEVVSLFSNNIYSENNLELNDIISNILIQKNMTISLFENITKGKILTSLLENNDKLINYINSIKVDNKFQNDDQLVNFSLDYLKESSSNLVVISCGEFKDNYLEFKFALADKNEVHIYNSTFIAKREDSLNMAVNSVMFHLIKKLRQNDFAF